MGALNRGVHLSVRRPLQNCLDTNRCPPLNDDVNYLVGVHCSRLCQWSICYRISAKSALCHLLDLAALTWRLLFICLELGHNPLLITKQGHMNLQFLSHLSFPFVSSTGSELIGTTQLFSFCAASLLFSLQLPRPSPPLCCCPCPTLLIDWFDRGICLWSSLSGNESPLTNFSFRCDASLDELPLEDAVEFLNSPTALDAAAKVWSGGGPEILHCPSSLLLSSSALFVGGMVFLAKGSLMLSNAKENRISRLQN